jgi:tetratricopeptide (TPR) repeat protein
MKELAARIQEILGRELGQEAQGLVDIVPLPASGDRMVRLRTLEEMLEEFDSDAEGSVGYFVQVKPRKREARRGAGTGCSAPGETGGQPRLAQPSEPLYLPDGKLNVQYLFRNAELLISSGEFALARNVYKAIIASGERTGLALYGTARCLEAEGRLEEAQQRYEEAIAYQPTAEAYRHLATLLIRRGKDQEAAEAMERALFMKELPQPLRFELHKACGNCWARVGNPESAQKHYAAALEANPTADDVRANLGTLLLAAGAVAEARRHFQDALASNARNDKALTGLASCFLAEGEKRLAHDYFAKALEVEIRNPSAIFHLIKCAYEIRSFATAARLAEDYAEAAPVNASLLYSLAGLQFHLGRMTEARATARRILEIQPQHAGAHELMGMIERYAGDPR